MFIGDIFALILSFVLALFYAAKYHLAVTKSKYFLHSIIFVSLCALVGIFADIALSAKTYLHALCITLVSVYFVFSFLALAYTCLYLISQILVHTRGENRLRQANLVILFLCSVYVMLLLLNIPMGILFTLDAGVYVRGPLFFYGAVADVSVLSLILLCYFRYRKSISCSLHLLLAQTLPMLALCFAASLFSQTASARDFLLALTHMAFCLNFHKIYVGEHALSILGDNTKFVRDTDYFLRRKRRLQLFFIRIQNPDALRKQYGNKIFDEVLFRFAFSLTECARYAHAYRVTDTDFVLSAVVLKEQSEQANREAVRALLAQGIRIGELQIELDYVIVEYTTSSGERSAIESCENMKSAVAFAHSRGERYISYFDNFAPEMQRRSHVDELVRTIDREHGYEVVFQPVSAPERAAFDFVRASARLYDTDGSPICAEELSAAAQQAGKSHALTYFVLEEVCRAMAENPLLSQMNALIDLPLSQLGESELLHRLNEITARYRISHERIAFAVSEGVTLPDADVARAAVRTISGMGYGFHLINLGALGSNLGTLLGIALRCVWLADTFLSSLGEKSLLHLTQLLHESGLAVATEGIQSAKDPERLRKLGVDYLCTDAFAAQMLLDELLIFLTPKK